MYKPNVGHHNGCSKMEIKLATNANKPDVELGLVSDGIGGADSNISSKLPIFDQGILNQIKRSDLYLERN